MGMLWDRVERAPVGATEAVRHEDPDLQRSRQLRSAVEQVLSATDPVVPLVAVTTAEEIAKELARLQRLIEVFAQQARVPLSAAKEPTP